MGNQKGKRVKSVILLLVCEEVTPGRADENRTQIHTRNRKVPWVVRF